MTPVMHFRRTATRDTELRGQKIREGDKVVHLLPVGEPRRGRLPRRRPLRRRPHARTSTSPSASAQHFCLGANLARLEIRVMFEELLRRLPDIELAGPVRRLRSNFINGIKHMPVRFTPEKRG